MALDRVGKENEKFVTINDKVHVRTTSGPTIISSGSTGAITVSTSAKLAAVSSSNLASRKLLVVQPIDGDIFWGFDNGVSTTTGVKIEQGDTAVWNIDDQAEVYLIGSGSTDVRVSEG